jgi:hypothetical protein
MAAVLKLFQVGQRVSFKDLEFGYELATLAADQAGPAIVEIGRDYLLLEDAESGVQTRLPWHTIRLAPPVAPAPVMPAAQVA